MKTADPTARIRGAARCCTIAIPGARNKVAASWGMTSKATQSRGSPVRKAIALSGTAIRRLIAGNRIDQRRSYRLSQAETTPPDTDSTRKPGDQTDSQARRSYGIMEYPHKIRRRK